MPRRIIYRIEREGVGPYRGEPGDLHYKYEGTVHQGDEHPSRGKDMPFDEWIKWATDAKYVSLCACPTLPKLREWFAGFLPELLEVGFKVYRFEVTEIVMGRSRKQCFFRPENVLLKKEVRRCHILR